jgi:hypothetical protein
MCLTKSSNTARFRGRLWVVCLTDWNDDGRLDLLAGDFTLEQRRPPPPDASQKAEIEKAQAEYNERLKKYRETIDKPSTF